MSSCRFAAVIPAYNPGEPVLSVVSETEPFVDAVILIDDGSDPVNKKYLHDCSLRKKVTLITFPENRGKGYALVTGLQEALKRLPEYIITLDSDGQHNPKEIEKFKDVVQKSAEPPDMVIGARRRILEMPFRGRLGNSFTALLFFAIFKRPVADTQSGFRMFSRGFAEDIIRHIPPGHYETEMKMLVEAVRSNRRISETTIDSSFEPFFFTLADTPDVALYMVK